MIGDTRLEIKIIARNWAVGGERTDDGKTNRWRSIPREATLDDIDGATVEFPAVKPFAFRRRRYGKLPVTSRLSLSIFSKNTAKS